MAHLPHVLEPQLSCNTIAGARKHFDIVVACEDEAGEDIDVPLVSIKYK